MARSSALRVPNARRAVRGRSIVADQQSVLSGGLNISADSSQLQPNQVRRAQNARLTVFGGLQKRLGSQNVSAAAIGGGAPVRSGFHWKKDDGTTQELGVSNGKLHYGTFAIPMTWTAVNSPTLASASVYPSFAAFRDASAEVVYIADGGKLLKWDGATLARSLTTPNVSRVWVYNQRLYGCSGLDAILLASGLNDGDDLGYTSGEGVQVPIRTFGESVILGGTALGVSNLIFHSDGISVWTGVTQDDIAVQAGTLGLTPDVGTINAASIVATETEVYFLSDRGFYAANSAGIRRISTTIDPDIFGLFTNAANLCAVNNRFYREVAYYLPDVGFYAFNYQLQAWTGPWNGGYISPVTHSCWESEDSDGTPIVLVGGSTGFVKQMDVEDVYTDNVLSNGTGGTAITMICQFRRMFFDNPPSDKALRYAYILVALNGSSNAGLSWATATSSGSFTLTQSGGVVWGTPSMVWGSFIWGSGDAQEYRIQLAGRGAYVDFTFTEAGTDTPPLISALRCDAFDYGTAHEYH